MQKSIRKLRKRLSASWFLHEIIFTVLFIFIPIRASQFIVPDMQNAGRMAFTFNAA